MPALPSYQKAFVHQFGDVSLAFSLFSLAPVPAALGMLEKNLITDLNEVSSKDIPLLALKAGTCSPSTPLPTWGDFEKHGDNVWGALNIDQVNTSILLASMIFAGANPWVRWERDNFNKVVSSFFALMCLHQNTPMVELLLSHPHCPSAETLQKETLQLQLRGDMYHYNTKDEEFPILHYLANAGNTKLIEVLLKKGFDVNVTDFKGNTPLYCIKEPAVAQFLVDKGAKVDVTNTKGDTPSKYWKSWIATAAKTAELNKIVIGKLKDSMSLEEIQDMQRPVLLQEIMRGTKTSVDSVYKKSKFPITTTFDVEGGALSLLGASVVRNDKDKNKVLSKYFVEKGAKWNFQEFNEPACTTAMLGQIFTNVDEINPQAREVLKQTHGPSFEAYQEDLLRACQVLSRHHINPENLLRTFCYGVCYPSYSEKMARNSSSYHSGPGVPYDFKEFKKIFDVSDIFPRATFDVLNQPNSSEVFHSILTSLADEKPLFNSSYLGSAYEDAVIETGLQIVQHAHDEQWRKTLPLLFAYSLKMGKNEYDYQKNKMPVLLLREKIMEVLQAFPTAIPSTEIQYIEKMLQDKGGSSMYSQQFQALVTKNNLLTALTEMEKPSSSPARRRM